MAFIMTSENYISSFNGIREGKEKKIMCVLKKRIYLSILFLVALGLCCCVQASHCRELLLLWSRGSRCMGSVAMVPGLYSTGSVVVGTWA